MCVYGLVACCRSFLYIYFYINRAEIQSLYTVYTTRRVFSCCPHSFRSKEGCVTWIRQNRNAVYEVFYNNDYSPMHTLCALRTLHKYQI
jgi:hypothetical protein